MVGPFEQTENDDPLIAYEDDFENDTVHHPYTAFNQGYEARQCDISLSLNPYDPGTREHDAWVDGWETNDEHIELFGDD